MTATPHLNEALKHTAQDLRSLGTAARQDLVHLRDEASAVGHQAKARIDGYAARSMDDARENLAHLHDYAAAHPFRAVAYAALGGVLLGLFLRR